MDPVQQLLDSMVAHTLGDCTAAKVARFHAEGLPAARRLAPVTTGSTLTAANVHGPRETEFVTAVMAVITWLVVGLDKRQLKDKAARQQALELLCALSDVLHAQLAAPPSQTSTGSTSSSSRASHKAKGSTLSRVLKLKPAGCMVQAMATTTLGLKRHVFQQGSSVSAQLLKVACLCLKRMVELLDGWVYEKEPQGTGEHLKCSHMLSEGCLEMGLLYMVAECVLLVLALPPGPFVVQGEASGEALVAAVLMAKNTADRLQSFVMLLSRWFMSAGLGTAEQPLLQLAQQGTSSTGDFPKDAPAPFLRLALVLLALGQYSRRNAGLPPGSVPNQPQARPELVSLLRAALQQQLTPSICKQMLQRLAPTALMCLDAPGLSEDTRVLLMRDTGDLCMLPVGEGLWAVSVMCDTYDLQPAHALGAEELQLVLECAELLPDASVLVPGGDPSFQWDALAMILHACPYPALVEFTTHHGRTLLTLAERSLEAGMAAAASGDSSSGSSSSSRAGAGAAAAGALHWKVAAALGGCLASCLEGRLRGMVSAAGRTTYEARGYPADATWALLDPSTAPRLLQLTEALLRTPGGSITNWRLYCVLPAHLPEMALFYSSPSTARATLSAVTSISKWLQARKTALQLLLDGTGNRTAEEAAKAAAAPRAAMADFAATPEQQWWHTYQAAMALTSLALQSLVRAAALVDAVSFQGATASTTPAAAAAATAAGRRSRAWLIEKALLADQTGRMVDSLPDFEPLLRSPAGYKAQLAAAPQQVAAIAGQLQQGVGSQEHAAAARQAGSPPMQQGGDVTALAEQLQAVQVGGSTSNESEGGGAAVHHASGTTAEGPLPKGVAGSSSGRNTSTSQGRSGTASSAAGGVPPVTPGDITVAANALLVACKAAGALCGVPQLLERVYGVEAGHGWQLLQPETLLTYEAGRKDLLGAVQNVAEWAVLLHPLLVQLLPAEQGQVLVDLRGRLGGSRGGSRTSGITQQQQQKQGKGSSQLSAEEVVAVLGALQHVVIPGQPGCSNPRCCCLEGVNEWEMKTQRCAGCRQTRYCSAACQKAHWRAGHKEVCKAAQAAAKAVAEAAVSASAVSASKP